MKYLTVSVAAYNAEKWLNKCLDSFVVPEVLEDIEVLIINDGSTDRTAVIAASYAEKYPESFVVINKENGGHGSTINVGIKAATGKYFKLVDADDWVEREGLVELIRILKLTEVDVVVSPGYVVNAENMSRQVFHAISGVTSGQQDRIVYIKDLDVKYNIAMHNITLRTELLKNNYIPIDTHCFYVDVEFVVYYFRLVKTIYISEIPVYNYLLGLNGQSVSRQNMLNRRDQHLKVCKRLLSCYQGEENAAIIREMIQAVCLTEYRILLSIPDPRQSLEELKEYEKVLRTSGGRVGDQVVARGIRNGEKVAYFLWLIRKFRYKGYRLAHGIVKNGLLN